MQKVILSPNRIFRQFPYQPGHRQRHGELVDVKTNQIIRSFDCEFGLDDSHRIITTNWQEGHLTLTVYTMDGVAIHTEIIPCVDHYNVGKWQEIHTEYGFDLYVFDGT